MSYFNDPVRVAFGVWRGAASKRHLEAARCAKLVASGSPMLKPRERRDLAVYLARMIEAAQALYVLASAEPE